MIMTCIALPTLGITYVPKCHSQKVRLSSRTRHDASNILQGNLLYLTTVIEFGQSSDLLQNGARPLALTHVLIA